MATAHPKTGQKCVFCKYWNGDANLVFKNKIVGFEFQNGEYGKCMANGSNQPCTAGVSCRSYEISYEASRAL